MRLSNDVRGSTLREKFGYTPELGFGLWGGARVARARGGQQARGEKVVSVIAYLQQLWLGGQSEHYYLVTPGERAPVRTQ